MAKIRTNPRHFRLILPNNYSEVWCHIPGTGRIEFERVQVHFGGDTYKLGQLRKGANGEWYLIPKNRESHAYPLDERDNVSGTGHKTVQACVSAHMLNAIREVEAAEAFALARNRR